MTEKAAPIGERALRDLRYRVDLYSVISRFIDLKKTGANWTGRCPFHDDSSPSFTVPSSKDKPFFHCFGCGAHGDAIDFLRKHQGLTFQQAVADLARDAGVTLEAGPRRRATGLRTTAKFRPMQGPKEGHHTLSDDSAGRLSQWQQALEGSPAHEYLTSRGISLQAAQAVGAGYLPAGQSMGKNAEGKATGFGPRVVFPHCLPDGRIVNLYGRSIDQNVDKQFKHRHLPGPKALLNPQALTLPGPLVIVEGAFDCLAMLEAGVSKAVAVFGLDGFDWRWIGKTEIIVALDHDAAGQAAAQKLMLEAAYRGLKATRLPLEAYGSQKDAAAAWAAGELQVDLLLRMISDAETDGATDLPVDDAFLRLERVTEAPAPHLVKGWTDFRAAAARFSTFYADDAAAAGWTDAELLSLPWNGMGTGGGALWALSGHSWDQLEVRANEIVLTTTGGGLLTYRRGEVTGDLP